MSPIAANYDESVFPHANEIDFDRESNPMISFGRGVHACLGQQIARMIPHDVTVTVNRARKTVTPIRLAVKAAQGDGSHLVMIVRVIQLDRKCGEGETPSDDMVELWAGGVL